MGFFKASTEQDDVKDGGNGGRYISESGIYEVTIEALIVDVNEKGARTLNMYVEYNGQKQMIFNAMRLENNDLSTNFGAKLFNKLCIIADIEDVEDPVDMPLPIGKGEEVKECKVLEQFCGMPVKVRIQMEYKIYEGNMQENKLVRNFFRYEDNATAAEIVNDVPAFIEGEEQESFIGKQFSIEEPKSTTSIYENVSEEDVKAWIAGGRGRNNKKTETAKPKAGFASQRKFGKK